LLIVDAAPALPFIECLFIYNSSCDLLAVLKYDPPLTPLGRGEGWVLKHQKLINFMYRNLSYIIRKSRYLIR
jgi:hypothetical protein